MVFPERDTGRLDGAASGILQVHANSYRLLRLLIDHPDFDFTFPGSYREIRQRQDQQDK
jgi:hypothetical protein